MPRSVLAPALFALVLTGCAGTQAVNALNGPAGDPTVAATVNGEDIPIARLEEQLATARANPQVAGQLEGDAEGTLADQLQSDLLGQLIRSALLEQSAQELGVEADQAAVDAQRVAVIEEVGGEEAFASLIAESSLTPEQVDEQLRQLTLQEGLTEQLSADLEVTDEEIEAFYEANAAQYGATATARHILVEDEATAQQAIERITAGEEFASVATELSTDTTSAQQGGELGPLTPGQTVPEFDEALFSAPLNELVGPVQTEFGFHVIEITERNDEGQPLEEVEGDIREQLTQQQSQGAVTEFLAEQSATATVTVNPRFGRWDAEQGAVVSADPLGDATTPPPSEGGQLPPVEGAPAPGAPSE